MASKCVKCDADVIAPKDCFKCTDCEVVCHTRCAGVVTRNKKWKCDCCATESASNSSKMSDTGSSNACILDAINAFRKENNERWDANTGALSQLREDVGSIKADVGSLKNQLLEVNAICDKNSKDITVLQYENSQLNEQLSRMKQQVGELEQHTRKCNVLVSGVPVTGHEDVFSILEAIARALNITFDRSDVSAAHRLQGKRGDSRPPSIVICFTSRWKKVDWLVARRRKGSLSARELAPSFTDQQVYLNEHLTPQTRSVFNGARELIKHKKLSSVWTTDCRVMAKVSPDHRPFRVRDLPHVAELAADPKQQPRSLTPPQGTTHPSRRV